MCLYAVLCYLDHASCLVYLLLYIYFTPQDGTTPLWIAAQMGHSEVVKVLLLRGADRDADRNVWLYITGKISLVKNLIYMFPLLI